MIYKASELLAKLTYLTLAGQNEEGDLEWIGTMTNWKRADLETKEFWTEMSWQEREWYLADSIRRGENLSFGVQIKI